MGGTLGHSWAGLKKQKSMEMTSEIKGSIWGKSQICNKGGFDGGQRVECLLREKWKVSCGESN